MKKDSAFSNFEFILQLISIEMWEISVIFCCGLRVHPQNFFNYKNCVKLSERWLRKLPDNVWNSGALKKLLSMRVAEGEVTHLVVKYKGQKMMIT